MMMMSLELLTDQASAALSGGGDCYPTPAPDPKPCMPKDPCHFYDIPKICLPKISFYWGYCKPKYNYY